jgi:hypothetical protein
VATAFIVGGFVILWAERASTRSASNRSTTDAARRLKLGSGAGAGADSRHLALGRDDHRRPVLRPVAQGGDRVFLLPGHADADRGDVYSSTRNGAAQFDDIGMWVVGFVAAFISAFLCVRWLLRYISSHDFTPFLPGIASPSASSCWPPGSSTWSPGRTGEHERRHSLSARLLLVAGVVEGEAAGRRDARRRPGRSFLLPGAVAGAERGDRAGRGLIIERTGELTLVGSSLGGYYATWLAEKHDLRAALVNPAVVAPELLAQCLHRHAANFHTGETFEFTPSTSISCARSNAPSITPARYLLLVETGDEVLDYREAVARYAGCRQKIFSKAATTASRASPICCRNSLNSAGYNPAMHVLFEEDGAFKAATILTDNDSSLQVETASGKRSQDQVGERAAALQGTGAGRVAWPRRTAGRGDRSPSSCGSVRAMASFHFCDFADEYFGHKPARSKRLRCCWPCIQRPSTSIARARGASARPLPTFSQPLWPVLKRSVSKR